jgi:hypothetical protein
MLHVFTTVFVFMILSFAVSFVIKVLKRIYPCSVMITKQHINDEISNGVTGDNCRPLLLSAVPSAFVTVQSTAFG